MIHQMLLLVGFLQKDDTNPISKSKEGTKERKALLQDWYDPLNHHPTEQHLHFCKLFPHLTLCPHLCKFSMKRLVKHRDPISARGNQEESCFKTSEKLDVIKHIVYPQSQQDPHF